MRSATVKPQIAPTMFPVPKPPESDTSHQPNMSKRRIETVKERRKHSANSEDFGDDGIDDDELMKASFGDLEFDHIENYPDPTDAITRKNTAKNKTKDKTAVRSTSTTAGDNDQEPVQLANGKWACNHLCKDRNACKHLCCKTGMDKPPKKKTATKHTSLNVDHTQSKRKQASQKGKGTQTKIRLLASKRRSSTAIEELDMTQQEKKSKADHATNGSKDFRQLHQLHKTVQEKDLPSSLHSVMHKKPAYCYSQGGEHSLSFMDQPTMERPKTSSDYGDLQFNELDSYLTCSQQPTTHGLIPGNDIEDPDEFTDSAMAGEFTACASETFGEDDSLLGDAMIGLADSQNLQAAENLDDHVLYAFEDTLEREDTTVNQDEGFPMQNDSNIDVGNNSLEGSHTSATVRLRNSAAHNRPLPYFDTRGDPSVSKGSALTELRQIKAVPSISQRKSGDQVIGQEDAILDILDMLNAQPAKDVATQEKPVPEAFQDLEPWLFREFGDIVELVDG